VTTERWGLTEEQYAQLEEEAVGLLSCLLRADTSNPPGDVIPAVSVLEEYFADNALALEVVGETPGLANCVARLNGTGGGASLLLLGHTDVVPADPTEWTEPPFSGRVRDGYVWGRGALDMKSQVAAQAVAMVRLARRAAAGETLRGDLVFAATADEETGDRCGAKWLLEHHPDLVRTDFVINEGGYEMLELGERRLYTIHAGEKGYAGCRIVVRGRGGHGSMPQHRGSVAHSLAQIVLALEEYEPEVLATRTPAELIEHTIADPQLRRRLKDPATARAALRELAACDPDAARTIEPQLGLTFATTNIRVGDGAVNVIPSHGEVIVDCRLLPGQGGEDVRREVARALAGIEACWEMELLNCVGSNQSPSQSALRDAIAATMGELVADADVICGHSSGFTDSAHVRTAFPGVVAYGFMPFIAEDGAAISPRLHGRDERIAIRDLVLQVVFAERLAVKLLA
jgi:acetylornithine deacetylase/succinyl-diaminopimelate desuccinylase-like protein